MWNDSPFALQLFTEKDAISGVVLPVTNQWDLPLGVLRGYVSETFAWNVAQSLNPWRTNVIAQLGDHDPSGVGAWENFATKVRGFADPAVEVEFTRLAVRPEQIDAMDLPTRPTKGSDPRSRDWTGGSVEVDAIPATQIRNLVFDWIVEHVDPAALHAVTVAEQSEQDVLMRLAARWAS